MSFRLKIILSVSAIQAVLLLLMIWHGLNVLRSSNEEALISRTYTTAKLFASTTQAAVLASDLGSLESLVNEVLSNRGIVYARVLSKQGVLAEGGDSAALKRKFVADTSLASAARDEVFDTYADIVVAGEHYGRVEIGFSTAAIQRLVADTRAKTLGFAALNMGLVALVSLLLGYYLTRQLKSLQAGTQRIANGELGHQIAVTSHDELAQTATAFNQMSAHLKQLDRQRAEQEAEIRQLNAELEQRVVERTAQLQDANKQLEHQALHDALTGLPNRVLFHDRLHSQLLHARRGGEVFALVGVDLNLFKEINDTLGHLVGDLVLQHVASACSRALRDSDTVARMGGDEFAILLPKVTDEASAIKVAERVLAMIKEPLDYDGRKIEISASLGVALYPDHGADAQDLVNHSDAAMYEAKRNQLGVVVYRSELGEGQHETITLKTDLRKALENHELVLHYQPKIDFGSQRINGVEALVRWQHPTLGLLYPDRFIQLAENNGLIKGLTAEVVRLALAQIRDWREQSLDLPVAINISALNLQEPGLPEWIGGMLAEYGVPAHLVELEVTETAIMTEPLRAIENIRKLASIGVQVSIDDFGTGYSSMACLRQLLVAKIKIDKSFVMDLAKKDSGEVIVRSTIDLAHNLGLKAVAEGVESSHVWDRLRELGCDSAQGYYMSKPLPPELFMEWLQGSPWGMKLPLAK